MKSFFQDIASFSYKKWTSPNFIEEGTFMENQQKRVFYKFLIILAFSCPTYLLTLPFPNTSYLYMNGVVLLVTAVLGALYFQKRLKLDTAFSLILLALQIEICVEVVCCAMDAVYTYQRVLIMSNMILSVLLVMISTCAYMGNTSILLSLLSVGAYSACVLITRGPFLTSYLPLMFIIYTLFAVLGKTLHKNTSALQKENKILRNEEAALLQSLQVNRDELFALAEVLNNEDAGRQDILLNAISPKAKKNLYQALSAHMMKDKCELINLKEVFPELSPSEIEICRLILQDKTVGQISEMLFKSPGNVTSQRANIRAKLGLEKTDNLKDVLLERVRAFEEQRRAERLQQQQEQLAKPSSKSSILI